MKKDLHIQKQLLSDLTFDPQCLVLCVCFAFVQNPAPPCMVVQWDCLFLPCNVTGVKA